MKAELAAILARVAAEKPRYETLPTTRQWIARRRDRTLLRLARMNAVIDKNRGGVA